jgi:hypothetical protein
MPDLSVACLEGSHVERALPLIRLVAPQVSGEEWRDQAAGAVEKGGGVIAVSAEDGLIHGIALFQPRNMLRLGRVLQVDDVITTELNRKAPVHRLLLDTLAHLARTLECTSLAMTVPAESMLFADGASEKDSPPGPV